MRLMRGLHGRLLLLLVLVVGLVMAVTAALVVSSLRGTAVGRIARSVHAQAIAADAVIARHGAAADSTLATFDIERRAAPPPGARPMLPLMLEVETSLRARLPDRDVRLVGTPARAWMRVAAPQPGWIGIAVAGIAPSIGAGLFASLLAAAVLVTLAAAAFARSLTRPLSRLARDAPMIVAGRGPVRPPRHASREIADLHAALEDAATLRRDADRERELVLAGLSHDMRTPLARLRYAVELEADGARDAMTEDIDQIDRIIEGFIGYVRDGRDEAEEVVDVARLLRDVVARQAGDDRRWQLDAPASLRVRARPLALRRALANLCANAVTHGGAPYRASAARSATHVVLAVEDGGAGVAPDLLPRLGEAFFRAETARTTPGSGLGLATVRRIAAQHGGSLQVSNSDTGGLRAELHIGLNGLEGEYVESVGEQRMR